MDLLLRCLLRRVDYGLFTQSVSDLRLKLWVWRRYCRRSCWRMWDREDYDCVIIVTGCISTMLFIENIRTLNSYVSINRRYTDILLIEVLTRSYRIRLRHRILTNRFEYQDAKLAIYTS